MPIESRAAMSKHPSPTSLGELDFKPYCVPFPSPRDWRDHFIYHLLIDRFDDGKDYPLYDPTKPAKREQEVDPCEVQGGKIRAIIRRLDYIQGLGSNAIWISPPFKNRQEDKGAHHGYAIQNFLEVDPRFGTLEDLRELVTEAHRRGIHVILDIVINHSGDNWGYAREPEPHPFLPNGGRHDFGGWRKSTGGLVPHDRVSELGPDDGVWPVELQDPELYSRRGSIVDFCTQNMDEVYHGDFFSLKDFNYANPKALDAMIKIYKWWIAQTDIDGFRIDTVMNTDPPATAIFINAIREYTQRIGKLNFLFYGEIVGDDDRLMNYIGGNTPAPGQQERFPLFTAVLDFPLYFILEEVIKEFKTPQQLRDRIERFRWHYRDFGRVGRYFVTFLDNHDQMARPYKRFGYMVDDWRQAALGVSYVLCSMGIPCIYYGTEQGFDGGGDRDVCVRETMFGGKFGAKGTTGVHFFNLDHPIYKTISKVATIRQKEPALRFGRQYFRQISGDGVHFGHPQHPGGLLAFSRVLDTEEVLVVLNLDPHDCDDRVEIDPVLSPTGCMMTNLLNGGDERHEVKQTAEGLAFIHAPVKARSIAIFKCCR